MVSSSAYNIRTSPPAGNEGVGTVIGALIGLDATYEQTYRGSLPGRGRALVADAWVHPADFLAARLTDAEDAAVPVG